jgi:thymidine kinase
MNNQSLEGYLKIILGPMFSGKTSYLINAYNDNISNNISTLAINHSLDNRYGTGEIISHDNISIPCIDMLKLSEIYNTDFIKYDSIIINEAQFFDDILLMVTVLVEKYNKNVIICGLDGDYRQKKFGSILDLIPICNEVTKLHGICHFCKSKSYFTIRITKETDQISIGNDNYLPVCRKCYNLYSQ